MDTDTHPISMDIYIYIYIYYLRRESFSIRSFLIGHIIILYPLHLTIIPYTSIFVIELLQERDVVILLPTLCWHQSVSYRSRNNHYHHLQSSQNLAAAYFVDKGK
jgi:hypothetical protein